MQIGTTNKKGCIQAVSHVYEWVDWNHWQEWVNVHLGGELLSSVLADQTTDKNGWTCIQRVSCSPVFEQIRTTDENVLTRVQQVSFSSVRRSELLTKMGEHWHPESELPVLSSVWVDQNHWQKWVNTYPASELLSSV